MRRTHSNWGNHLSWRPLTLPSPILWRNSINMYTLILSNLLFVPSAIIYPCTLNIVWYTDPTTKHISSASLCPISNDRVWKSETLKFGDGSATKANTREATVNTVVFQPWPLSFLANHNRLVTRNTTLTRAPLGVPQRERVSSVDWTGCGWDEMEWNGIDSSVSMELISSCSANKGTDIGI